MTSYQRAVSQFFSISKLNQMITNPDSEDLIKLSDLMSRTLPVKATNQDVVIGAYRFLRLHYRNEYFFKNTLLNKILLGRHSLKTSVALRELPVAGSILDFLIINGIGQVYEIKTELDNLERIASQIDSYYRAFTYVNIVTDESHLSEVITRFKNTDVGIIELTKRVTLNVIQEPQEHKADLSHEAIFKILRKREYELILQQEFKQLPQVNQFKYYRTCLDWFNELDINQCHLYLLQALKRRSHVLEYERFFKQVPVELANFVYFSNYHEADYEQLFEFLEGQVQTMR